MRPSAQGPTTLPSGVRDGRDVRWEAHRTKRRRQLVEAALKAIRKHGAGVGMDEIAATAGTSKTVLYRHLGDRSGLYRAVVAAVDERILADLAQAQGARDERPSREKTLGHPGEEDVVDRITAMVRAYLSMVERDPQIYRFVMTRPLETTEGDPDDPVHRITGRIGEQLTEVLREHLLSTGRADQAAVLAPVWGHGIVGLVRATSERWLTRGPGSPDEPGRGLTIDQATHAVIELIRPALTHPGGGPHTSGSPAVADPP